MGPDWVRLPNLILIEIFSYLNRHDRIQASSVNSGWRACLFYPKFWYQLQLKFTRCPQEFQRSDFLYRNVPFRCLQEVIIVFDDEMQCHTKVLQSLVQLTKSINLMKLELKPQRSVCKAVTESVIKKYDIAINTN